MVSSYPIVGWRYVLVADVPISRRFRLIIVGSRQVLLLAVPFGGGFVLSFPWCALGVGFGRYPEPQKALEFLPRLS